MKRINQDKIYTEDDVHQIMNFVSKRNYGIVSITYKKNDTKQNSTDNIINLILKLYNDNPLTDDDIITIIRQITYDNIYINNKYIVKLLERLYNEFVGIFTGIIFTERDGSTCLYLYDSINNIHDAKMVATGIHLARTGYQPYITCNTMYYHGMKYTCTKGDNYTQYYYKNTHRYKNPYKYQLSDIYIYIRAKYLIEASEQITSIYIAVNIYLRDEYDMGFESTKTITMCFGDKIIKKFQYADLLKYNFDIECLLTELAEQLDLHDIEIIFPSSTVESEITDYIKNNMAETNTETDD